MNDIIKIVQALEDSNLLLKGVTKTIKNETKKKIYIDSFGIDSSLTTGILKKLLNITRKKIKKKHHKILMLAKSKLNSMKALISQALIDMEVSHKEFITILKGKINMKR